MPFISFSTKIWMQLYCPHLYINLVCFPVFFTHLCSSACWSWSHTHPAGPPGSLWTDLPSEEEERGVLPDLGASMRNTQLKNQIYQNTVFHVFHFVVQFLFLHHEGWWHAHTFLLQRQAFTKNVHLSFLFCRWLRCLMLGYSCKPQCSLLCPRSSVPPSGFWIWSWPCAQDLPGSDPAETSTPTNQKYCSCSRMHSQKKRETSKNTSCPLTCRFLLIFRILCCSRNLFSRAKRLCWSSNWARRSWNRTLARESCSATVSLQRHNISSLADVPNTSRWFRTLLYSYQSMLSIHLLRYWRMSMGNVSS